MSEHLNHPHTRLHISFGPRPPRNMRRDILRAVCLTVASAAVAVFACLLLPSIALAAYHWIYFCNVVLPQHNLGYDSAYYDYWITDPSANPNYLSTQLADRTMFDSSIWGTSFVGSLLLGLAQFTHCLRSALEDFLDDYSFVQRFTNPMPEVIRVFLLLAALTTVALAIQIAIATS